MPRKHDIYKTLKAYAAGDLDKYEAMDVLDIDTVRDFLTLVAEYELSSTEPVCIQSSPDAPALAGFLKHG